MFSFVHELPRPEGCSKAKESLEAPSFNGTVLLPAVGVRGSAKPLVAGRHRSCNASLTALYRIGLGERRP